MPPSQPDAGDGLGELAPLRIKRASTAEQVAEMLREMILSGELQHSGALREVALARRVGVSRNTMREAIRVLAREGLVTHHLHRGALVTRLTASDVEDLFRVRRTVELAAVAAAATATDESLESLGEAVDQMAAATHGDDWGAVIDADQLFHERLVALLDSRRLARFFDGIQAELRLCMSIIDRQQLEHDELVKEHRQIYELLRARRTEQCVELMGNQLELDERRLKEIVAEGAA
jgi:DNA-binding GntR family transcriptional regulator